MATRTRTTSVKGEAAGFAGAVQELDPPPGTQWKDEAEYEAWVAFSRARAIEDWMPHELVNLVKVAKLEAKIVRAWQQIDDTSPLIKVGGSYKENPLIRVVDMYQKTQLSLMRSLQLTSTQMDPKTLNSRAAAQASSRGIVEKHSGSLLAMPVRR